MADFNAHCFTTCTRKIEEKYTHYTVVEWVKITQKTMQDFLVPACSLGHYLSYETCMILFWSKERLWNWSEIYVVKFDLCVFIKGFIFQKLHNNIKGVVWYEDSRFQAFIMILTNFNRNFWLWNLSYLTKISNFEHWRMLGWDLYQTKALNV